SGYVPGIRGEFRYPRPNSNARGLNSKPSKRRVDTWFWQNARLNRRVRSHPPPSSIEQPGVIGAAAHPARGGLGWIELLGVIEGNHGFGWRTHGFCDARRARVLAPPFGGGDRSHHRCYGWISIRDKWWAGRARSRSRCVVGIRQSIRHAALRRWGSVELHRLQRVLVDVGAHGTSVRVVAVRPADERFLRRNRPELRKCRREDVVLPELRRSFHMVAVRPGPQPRRRARHQDHSDPGEPVGFMRAGPSLPELAVVSSGVQTDI